MSEFADEIERVWQILEVIESHGGAVEDFDVDVRDADGIAGAMSRITGGSASQEGVYTFRITVPGVWEDVDDPASVDIEDVGEAVTEDGLNE